MQLLSTPARKLLALACLAMLALHLVHALSYAFLTDDAYISFRYVQNALEGNGLVFNVGERVEGYTNFLWVVQLVILGTVGIDPQDGALLLGIIYSIGSVGLSLVITRACVPRRHALIAAFVCAAYLALNRSFAIWTTGGLETRSCTFFILLGLLGCVRFLHDRKGLICFAVGWIAASLTRPDAIMLGAIAGIGLLIATRDVKRLVPLGIGVATAIGAHFLWRKSYYGDWFPNTYYAKIGAPWWDVGSAYVASLFVEYGLWLAMPLAVVAAVLMSRRGAKPFAIIVLMMFAAQALYQARIGGDHFEFRPFDFWWPLLGVLLGVGASVAMTRLRRPLRVPVLVGGGALVALYGCAIPMLSNTAAESMTTRQQAIFQPSPISAEVLGSWRLVPGLGPLVGLWNRLTDITIPHAVGVRYFEHRINTDFLLGMYAPFEGVARSGGLPPDTVMRAGAVGIVSYFMEVRIIDEFGLTDKVVARTPTTRKKRLMAHDREPPPGYLEQCGVNFERPLIWRTLPQELETERDLYVVTVPDGRVISFTSSRPEWVEKAFAGRIVKRPG